MTRKRPVLVLGGTSEGRELAGALVDTGVTVVSSLAGRVSNPRLPAGEVRIGGFGGPSELARWLVDRDVMAVVDATHPFAENISASAAQACPDADVPLVRLERPGWTQGPDDNWHWVDSLDAAATALVDLGTRVFLTTGRQGLASFSGTTNAWFLIRCVQAPEPPLPPKHRVLLDRGPYLIEGELALIDEHRIEVLVTKDSGGTYTRPKLDAARSRGLPVIVVRRPCPASTTTVTTVTQALAWLGRNGYRG